MELPEVGRIAVALPVRNEAEHLEAALASVMGQTRRPDLVVIADNCSTDATREIADSFVDRYPGVVELHPAPDPLSVVQNWDRARSLAIDRCDRFMWLGGHDRISVDYLEAMQLAFAQGTVVTLAVPAVVSEALHYLGDPTPQVVTEDFSWFTDTGISLVERVHRVGLHLGNHAFVHGLWRSDFVSGIPLHPITNDDRLWLMRAAASGGAVRAHGGEIVCGVNRPPEGSTSPERRARYRRAGIDTGARSVVVYSTEATRIILRIPEPPLRRRLHVLARVLVANLDRSKAPWIRVAFSMVMRLRSLLIGAAGRR